MAEEEGFEPPVPVKVQQFSRLPVSTAHPFLRVVHFAAQLYFTTTLAHDFDRSGMLPIPVDIRLVPHHAHCKSTSVSRHP